MSEGTVLDYHPRMTRVWQQWTLLTVVSIFIGLGIIAAHADSAGGRAWSMQDLRGLGLL